MSSNKDDRPINPANQVIGHSTTMTAGGNEIDRGPNPADVAGVDPAAVAAIDDGPKTSGELETDPELNPAPPIMPYYQCGKIVQAVRITTIDVFYNRAVIHYHQEGLFNQIDIPLADYHELKPQQGGYLIVLPDMQLSYECEGSFESYYTELAQTDMNFSEAWHWLLQGKRVSREAWLPAEFIFLVPGSTFKVNRAPLLGIYPEGTQIDYRTHIDLKADDGTVGFWSPAQDDILTNDWYLAE